MIRQEAVQLAQEVYRTATELRNNIERFAGNNFEGTPYETARKLGDSITDELLDEKNRELLRQRLQHHETKLSDLKRKLEEAGMI